MTNDTSNPATPYRGVMEPVEETLQTLNHVPMPVPTPGDPGRPVEYYLKVFVEGNYVGYIEVIEDRPPTTSSLVLCRYSEELGVIPVIEDLR